MDSDLWELYEDGKPEDEVAAIIRLGHYAVIPKGVRIITQFSEIITVRTTRANLLKLSGAPEVADIEAGDLYMGPEVEWESAGSAELSSDTILPTDERRPKDLQVTGRGVVVGVVDWGFDFAHPDFRNRDGSTRILALWDQRGSKLPNSPQPFGYGVVRDRDTIDRALKQKDPYEALHYHPADADTGMGCHGTHVLSIAAGGGGEDRPTGMAPEADIVVVHNAPWDELNTGRLGDSVTLLEAIDFIVRTAGDRPWVINLSMGRHGEQHDGSTLIEQGLDAAIRSLPGRAVCLSAGNYFNKRIHASGQLRPTQERTLVWDIRESKPTYNQLEFWYSWQDKFEVLVRSPDGGISGRAKVGERAKFMVGGKEVGNVYHRAQEPNNLDNHITIYLYKNAPTGEWEVTLIGTDVIDGRYHAWIERDVSCPSCQSRFRAEDSDPKSTTGTICNGRRTLAVGAYNKHDPEMRLGPFSSVGPTRDGRLKPDLCAPGVSVLAARSSPRNPQGAVPILTRMSGTSMASPHVTGTVALMFQAAPRRLRIEETHNLLLQSAQKVSVPEDIPERIGIGFLDVEAAVDAASKVTSTSSPFKQTTVLSRPRVQATKPPSRESEFVPDAESIPEFTQSESGEWESEAESIPKFTPKTGGDAESELLAEHAESESPEIASEEKTCRCGASEDVRGIGEAEFVASGVSESSPTRAQATSFVEMADAIVQGNGRRPSVHMLHEMLDKTGVAEALTEGEGGFLPDAAAVFDTIAYDLPGRVQEQLAESVEVVARPGSPLEGVDPCPGDIMIRRGDGDYAHISVLAEGELHNLESVLGLGLTPESFNPGQYAQVIETGPYPHESEDKFARQLTDSAGRLLNDILLLRLATPTPTVVNVQQPGSSGGESDPVAVFSSWPSQLAAAVQGGAISLEIGLSIFSGNRDANALTNAVFYARHPEIPVGQKIQSKDTRAVEEWLHIREQMIKPLLQAVSPVSKGVSPSVPLFLGIDQGDVDENHNVDWARAKAEGPVSFAIIRAHTGWRPDYVFKREWPRIKDAGIVRGAYLFLSFPNNKYSAHPPNPLTQVEGFVKTVGDLEEGDFPPSLDVEFPGNWTATGMTHEQLLEGVHSAWRALKERYRVAPLIYTSARVWREDLNNLPAAQLTESPLWLTPYPFGIGGSAVRNPEAFVPGGRYKTPPVPAPWGEENWWIHQYQGDAHNLPGFRQVDMNRFNPMSRGATGERVKWVQLRLGIAQSGLFDAATEGALRAFQQRKNLKADGAIDPRTFAFLCWSNPQSGLQLAQASEATPTREFLSANVDWESATPAGRRQPDTDVPCPRPATILDHFEKNKEALIPAHFPIIAELARRIVDSQTRPDPAHEVCIGGHTDSSGTSQFNHTLSRQRADAVQAELLRQIAQLSPGLERILATFVYGAGAEEPVAADDTGEGRARNRRVEVYLNNRYKPGTQASVRIDVVPLGAATTKEQEDTAAGEAIASPTALLLGESRSLTATGAPLPPGKPAYVWISKDPEVALVSLADGNSQTHPSSAIVRGAKAGETEIQVTYTNNQAAQATSTVKVNVTAITASLLDPPGCVCAEVNELIRPLTRSSAAHRTMKFRLEPAAFWAGKRVRVAFRVNGAQRGALGAAHPNNLEAVPGFAFANGIAVLTSNGTTAIRVNMPAIALNGGVLELTSVEFPQIRKVIRLEVAGRVVLDPGHGGSANLPGSSSNNATSVSGVLEKTMTLDFGLRVRDAMKNRNHIVHVFLTRDDDFNIAGAERAHVAHCQRADTLVSIHMNSDPHPATRGTEVFVRADANGNVNRAEDVLLADRILAGIVGAIANGVSRGVKDDTQTKPGSLAVLSDGSLGNTAADHPVRACLAEVEFITNPDADQLLNGRNRDAARNQIANAVGDAIIADLQSRT